MRIIAGEKAVVLEEERVVLRSAVEEDNELLYAFGLLRDDLLNFLTCMGLLAVAEHDGEEQKIPYWHPQVSLDADRLAKLFAIHCPHFADLVQKIRETKRAGYQEGLVEKLAEDMRGLVYG